MTRHVEVVHPDSTLEEAAEKMKRFDIGPLPVCDGDRLVGLITDRDIIVRSVARGGTPPGTGSATS
jgi:CBS domain-containing protein